MFDLTNKIKIGKIRIQFDDKLLSNEDKKKSCAKICKKIESLEIPNLISNDVSCFI